jgi:glycosyltransferase involved in cell wall biosynthesis/O-antigen/teichoic acid export membrane protein
MQTTTDPKKTFLNFRLAERLGRSLPMIRKGSLALIAQVLVSGMNFLLGLLLARWLVPAQYGAYTLAFSVFLVVASVHNALLLEPMGVLGPALFGQTLKSYVGKLIRIHFALAAGFVVVMAAGGLLISRTPHFAALSGAIAGACLATPWVLFLWFARQAAYLEMRPDIAAKGAITYAVAIAVTIFALHAAGWLTPFGAFLALAAGSIVGGCFLLAWIRPKFRSSPGDPTLPAIWKQHWTYGRWVLVTSLVYWISGQAAYYFIAAAFLKIEDVGAISALQNLVAPLSQFLTALSLLLLPWASAQFAGKNDVLFGRAIRRTTLLFSGVGIAYFVAVVGLGKPLVAFLYHGTYSGATALIPMLALSQVFMAISQGPVIGLRAMQRPSRIFVGYSVAAVFSIIAGLALTRHWGTFGNVTGMAASSFCFLLTTVYCYWSERRRPANQAAVRDGALEPEARVAWLLPSMDRGNYWQPLLKEFSQEFPQTRVFTGKWNGYLPGYENSFQLETVPGYRFVVLKKVPAGYNQGFFWLPLSIVPRLFRFRPTVIFTSAFSLWSLYALVFKLFTGARVIILWDGNSPATDYRTSNSRLAFRRLIGRWADGAVSNMRAGVEYLQGVIRMKEETLLCQPYQVPECSVLRTATDGPQLDFAPRPTFLFVGSLISRKGWSGLIEAANLLRQGGMESFSVILAGSGEQMAELNELVHSHRLEQHVTYVGKVPYQNLGAYYQAADVFVLPTHEDVWGLVLLEAMAFGKPVLCSTYAGASEMVTHGENGFIFDSHKPSDLADGMARFIQEPSLIERFGARAANAVARYTPKRAARSLAGLVRGKSAPLPEAKVTSSRLHASPVADLISD